MCTYSMAADMFRDRWEPEIPTWPGIPIKPYNTPDKPSEEEFRKKIIELLAPKRNVTEQEFEELKRKFEDLRKELEWMKDLLKRSKEYDIKNNEPDCEMDEKVEFIKRIAEYMGVDIKDALPTPVQIPISSGTTIRPNIGPITYTHSNDGV